MSPMRPGRSLANLIMTVVATTLCACGGGGDDTPEASLPQSSDARRTALLVANRPAATTAIAPEDIALKIDPTMTYAEHEWRTQCDGQFLNADEVPNTGIRGANYGGGGDVLKFGKMTSATLGTAPVYLFRAQPDNLYVGGSPRCEVGFQRDDQALPRGQVFWHAFSMWIENWGSTTDRMSIAQWYHGLQGAGLNPPLTIVVSGKSMWADVRYSTATESMSSSDQVLQKVFQITDGSFYGRWVSVVIQAKISPVAGEGGFMRVYVNGTQLGNYNGPIGYAVDGAAEEVVHGVYPLIKGAIPYDLSKPVRKMYLKKSLVVRDPTGKYTLANLMQAIK